MIEIYVIFKMQISDPNDIKILILIIILMQRNAFNLKYDSVQAH